jgi:predicted HD phosphohydrolase
VRDPRRLLRSAVGRFEAQPRPARWHLHASDAVRLRLWDDLAKVENAVTPPLAHFVASIEAAQRPANAFFASPST